MDEIVFNRIIVFLFFAISVGLTYLIIRKSNSKAKDKGKDKALFYRLFYLGAYLPIGGAYPFYVAFRGKYCQGALPLGF